MRFASGRSGAPSLPRPSGRVHDTMVARWPSTSSRMRLDVGPDGDEPRRLVGTRRSSPGAEDFAWRRAGRGSDFHASSEARARLPRFPGAPRQVVPPNVGTGSCRARARARARPCRAALRRRRRARDGAQPGSARSRRRTRWRTGPMRLWAPGGPARPAGRRGARRLKARCAPRLSRQACTSSDDDVSTVRSVRAPATWHEVQRLGLVMRMSGAGCAAQAYGADRAWCAVRLPERHFEASRRLRRQARRDAARGACKLRQSERLSGVRYRTRTACGTSFRQSACRLLAHKLVEGETGMQQAFAERWVRRPARSPALDNVPGTLLQGWARARHRGTRATVGASRPGMRGGLACLRPWGGRLFWNSGAPMVGLRPVAQGGCHAVLQRTAEALRIAVRPRGLGTNRIGLPRREADPFTICVRSPRLSIDAHFRSPSKSLRSDDDSSRPLPSRLST